MDGSMYSGSGTIVRDGATFAALTGQAVHLINVRTQRDRPGLQPQGPGVITTTTIGCQVSLLADM